MLLRKTIFQVSDLLRKFGLDFDSGKHPAVLEMQRCTHQLQAIHFKVEAYPDGSWVAESVNVDGIITGGKDIKEINSVLKDAIFTYFGVPPYLCNDKLLMASNEPVHLEQRVWAVR